MKKTTLLTKLKSLAKYARAVPVRFHKRAVMFVLLCATLGNGVAGNARIAVDHTAVSQGAAIAENTVYFLPVYSRILNSFNASNSGNSFHHYSNIKPQASFLPASQNHRSFVKNLLTFQPGDFNSQEEAEAILGMTITTPMFKFKNIGFPNVETHLATNTSTHKPGSAYTPYKPYRSLLKIRKTQQGKVNAVANVSCMGHDPAVIVRRGARYDSIITRMSTRFGVDPDLVRAVATQESCFYSNITSPVGAKGLMQLMPKTARLMGTKDAYNPEQNLRGGVRYLAKLQRQFDDIELVLAAYNAGPGNVMKYGGIPPFSETRHYVTVVLENYRSYKADREFKTAMTTSAEPNRSS